jgi:hypothetical protein
MSDIAENTKEEVEEATATLINELFQMLRSIFPAFNQAWPTQEILDGSKREWLRAFMENGINNADKIKLGLDGLRLKTSPFIPTAGEFISLCVPKPEKLGAPTHAAAYAEAVRRSHPCYGNETWSHKAIYHAWHETGARAISGASGPYQIKEVRDIFFSKYDLALKMISDGEKLREIPKIVEFKLHVTIDGLNFEAQGTAMLTNFCIYHSLGGKLSKDEFMPLFEAEINKSKKGKK